MTLFVQLLANGLITGCVYSLLALGFSLIYSTTHILHFAYAITYTATAYILYQFLIVWHVNLYLSIPVALIFAALLGILIEVLIYKPLNNKQAPLAIFMISSIGINILFENLIAMIWGNETKILRPGVEKTYAFGPIILNRIQLSQVAVFLFFSTSLLIFLKYHKMGKIIRATADNAALTMVMGADVNRIRLIVFGLGSFLAGISSILIALDVGVDPHVGFNAVLCGAVATIVGGIGIFGGAIVGAFVLGIAQSLVIWQASARWEQAITFVILVFFLLFRPQGLLGQKKRQEEG